MTTLDAVGQGAAAVAFAVAILVIAVALARTPTAGRAGAAQLAAGVALGLEFLLAAGLLRLSAVDDFRGLAVVAAIVALRKLISTGMGLAVRAFSATRIRRIRA